MELRKDAFACRDPRVILQLSSTGTLRLSARVRAARGPPEGVPARRPAPTLIGAADARGARCAARPRRRGGLAALARALARPPPRRRAAFVPAGSRAKRVSLGALAAFTVGPTASLASGSRRNAVGRRTPNRRPRPNTASCSPKAPKAARCSCSSGRSAASTSTASSDPKPKKRCAASRPATASTVDGIVGPQTSAALRGEAASARPSRRSPRASAARGEEGRPRRTNVDAADAAKRTAKPAHASGRASAERAAAVRQTATSGRKQRPRCAACRPATASPSTASSARRRGASSASRRRKR